MTRLELGQEAEMDASGLTQAVLDGRPQAVARLLTLVEASHPTGVAASAALFPHTGQARTIGITGVPGAGKSSLVDQLVATYRELGLSVGVLAVDPSSPFTHGALLGDRVRMRSFAHDDGVFIRSMADRGHGGGIAIATPVAMRVLDAMGMDRIIVETVGVGQSEIAVADAVDCTVVVEVPGMGDSVQTMKAGLMEIADQFVVNKADRSGAKRVSREIRRMVHERGAGDRPDIVVQTVATTGEGVADLVKAVEGFIDAQESEGALEDRRVGHLQKELIEHVTEKARRQLALELHAAMSLEIDGWLRSRARDPESIAQELVDRGLGRSDLAEPSTAARR
jgi:LAO/AO transport system kinase